MTQQPASASTAYPLSRADQLSDNLFPSIFVFLYVAVVFFLLGLALGKQQQRQDHDTTIWQRQAQTLERIWRSTADRKD